MNVPLLRKVQQRILAEPEHFDMDTWGVLPDGVGAFTFSEAEEVCGTAACIGGHALLIASPELSGLAYHYTDDAAAIALGLSASEASLLFYVGNWPWRYADAYFASETREERAKIASDRIDDFIEKFADKDSEVIA
jgi:hypothetical protein